MIDANETLGFALDDFGMEALINGGPETITIDPYLDASTEFNGESVDHSGPFAIAVMADVEGLAAGDHGDSLTILGNNYTLLAIDPDGQGGAVLRLEEKP